MLNHVPRSLGYSIARLQTLRDKLNRVLLLKTFEPDAFAHGPCKTRVVGNVRFTPDKAQFLIIFGDGSVKAHMLHDVPRELWPAAVCTDYKRGHGAPNPSA